LSYKTFWTDAEYDKELRNIRSNTEIVLNQIANSIKHTELSKAEEFPILIENISPFKPGSKPARICAKIVPIGILFKMVSIPFEKRIRKDLQTTQRLCKEMQGVIRENSLEEEMRQKEIENISEKPVIEGNFTKLRVNVNDCEIISRSHFVEVPQSNSKWQALDNLRDSTPVREEIIMSVIEYKNPKTDRIFSSPAIYMDKMTLNIILQSQKYIDIYIDRTKKGVYGFDLSFLDPKLIHRT
jgi:hypothetical protein